jgi:hypothetical protein
MRQTDHSPAEEVSRLLPFPLKRAGVIPAGRGFGGLIRRFAA